MPAFVKTKKDEERWSKAKSRAKDQGREGDWAYVTGIYKSMKGGKVGSFGDLPDPAADLDAVLDRIEKAAAYSKEFMGYVKGRRFRNPDTGNEVVFRSLPSSTRRDVYRQWKQDKAVKGPEPKTRPVFPDVPGLNKKKTRALMRDIVDEMKAAEDAAASPDYHQVIRDHVDNPTPEQELAIHRGVQSIVKDRLKQMQKPRKSDEDYDYDYARWKRWLDQAKANISGLREESKSRKKRERRGPLVDPSRVDESVRRIQKVLDRTKGEMPRLSVKFTLRALESLAKNPKEERRVDKVRDRIRYLREKGTKRDRALADEMASLLRDSGLSMRRGDYERRTKAAAEESLVSESRRRDAGDNEKRALKENKVGGYPKEFLERVRGKKFRNPNTNNDVKFTSLPSAEQKRIYEYWNKHQHGFGRGEKGWVQHTEKIDRLLKNWERRPGLEGMRKKLWSWSEGGDIDDEDLEYLRRAGIAKKKGDGMTSFGKKVKRYLAQYGRPGTSAEEFAPKSARWHDLTLEQRRQRARKAFSPMMVVDEEPVVLPADVKRVSAERLRELGRSMMIAGMRAPRQQMISIAVTLDALLDHLKMLGEQNPGLNALRRRVLLKLREQVLGAR